MTDVERFELERNGAHVRVAVFAGIARQRLMRQRRSLALVAGAGLVLASCVAVGAAKLAPEPVPGSESYADCYASDDPYAPHNSLMAPPEEWNREVILSACSEIVRVEESELGICVDQSGYTAVLKLAPGESNAELCERLGLPLWEDQP